MAGIVLALLANQRLYAASGEIGALSNDASLIEKYRALKMYCFSDTE
jgi:hypothetical protein